jgi:hypothetical protein
MTREEEAKFLKQEEAYFRGQRELPPKRDYRWNSYRFITAQDRSNFRRNFDRIFPHAPGRGI